MTNKDQRTSPNPGWAWGLLLIGGVVAAYVWTLAFPVLDGPLDAPDVAYATWLAASLVTTFGQATVLDLEWWAVALAVFVALNLHRQTVDGVR